MNANTIRVLKLCVTLLPLAVVEPARAENRAISSGRNDVVYLAPAIDCFEALPLGNGQLGATVWNEKGMSYQLNHGSFFASADQNQFLISSGHIDLPLPDHWMKGFVEQRLALHEGVVITEFKTAGATIDSPCVWAASFVL